MLRECSSCPLPPTLSSLTANNLYNASRGIFNVLTQKQYVFEINQSRLNFRNEESPLESQACCVCSASKQGAVYLQEVNVQGPSGHQLSLGN